MKRILHGALNGALICALIVGVSIPLWQASVSAHPHATAIEIYVRGDFVDDDENHMYNTIQKGINAARDGFYDTVYVYGGTYTENIVVDKSTLTIQGELSSLVTVNGNGSDHTLEIIADDVRVTQLKITGATGTGWAGVYWGNVMHGAVDKCDITGNYLGVALQSLVNQNIECNNIHNNSNDGIKVTNSEKTDIIMNDISYNQNGISLGNCTKMTIIYNKSYSNSGYGIYVDSFSSGNDIYLNDFSGNTAGDGYQEVAADNNWETPNQPAWLPYCYGGAPYSSMRGNNWDDYTGSDTDGDGIGDTPYSLGSEADDFPLISSYTNYPMGTCPGSPVLPCTDEVAPPSPAIFNPPSNLTATAVSSSQIDLSWQDNSDDELGFRIERKTGAESYTEIDTVLAGVENYPDTGLEPNTTYDYRVCAYNLAGDSDYAEDLETTPALGPGGCFIATAAYGTEAAVEIDVLRAFRDEVLLESALGSQLVELYYRTSPPVADFISENSLLRTIVRELVVDPIVLVVEAMEALWRN